MGIYKIGNVCKINMESLKSLDKKDEILYLETSDITDNIITNIQRIPYGEAPSRAQRKVKDKTIIISTVRPNLRHMGILSNPSNNMIVSSGFCTLDIKNDNDIDAHYLYYFLSQTSVINYLHTIAQNAVSSYPSINPSDIAGIAIRFPLIKEQRNIGKVLLTIDRKIELNKSINHNLEAMAKQLYDYWFVQFDFPDENGRPYKSSGGKMVWNEKLKREIPEGWNICPLSSYIVKNNTGNWGGDKPKKGHTLKVGCIRGADIIKLNELPQRYINDDAGSSLLSPWDIVIEVSGGSPNQATGRSAYITPGVIDRNGGKIICSNFCHAFTIKDKILSAYFFYTWNMFYDNDIMFNYEGKTSGIKNFMTTTFLSNMWLDIPHVLAEKFFAIIEDIYKRKDLNEKANIQLTKLRDKLLPMLMNGQVSVNYDS